MYNSIFDRASLIDSQFVGANLLTFDTIKQTGINFTNADLLKSD
jgi:hypothetical protein